MSRSYTLDQDYELRGSWWKPENPSARMAGTLKYQVSGRISLELYGPPQDFTAYIGRCEFTLGGVRELPRIPLLMGILENNETAYLLDGYEADLIQQVYYHNAHNLIIGGRFQDYDSVKFPKLSVRFSHLEKWSENIQKDVERSFYEKGIGYEKATISEYDIPAIDSKIRLYGIRSSQKEKHNKVGITWERYLEINPSSPKPLKWYIDQILLLRNYFTLIWGYPVFVIEMSGFYDDKGNYCNILAPQRGLDKYLGNFESVTPHNILLSFDHDSYSFQESIEHFFSLLNDENIGVADLA